MPRREGEYSVPDRFLRGFRGGPSGAAAAWHRLAPQPGGYPERVSSQRIPGGVVHKLPTDLRTALVGNVTALAAWKDITPLARNEFICWVEDAKQDVTRQRRIRRTQEELEEGMRRPCCWPGCKHRERNGR
jgi:Bacteriocin-protection, YdeI or OmpD-Associated